jgi:hypothetical protein
MQPLAGTTSVPCVPSTRVAVLTAAHSKILAAHYPNIWHAHHAITSLWFAHASIDITGQTALRLTTIFHR